jgi:hypothetical protein
MVRIKNEVAPQEHLGWEISGSFGKTVTVA